MGVFSWLTGMYQTNLDCSLNKIENKILKTDFNSCEICNRRKNLFYSKSDLNIINDKFLDNDGYFTKLISDKNKVLGYIFRCTHKNVEVEDINKKKYVIPYLVTCYYQPNLEHIPVNYIKAFGKERSLKIGIRSIKNYVKNITDVNIENLNKSFKDVFLNYEDNEDFNMLIDNKEYNNIIDYVKSFDDKVFKYYAGVDPKNIVKIWLKY